VRNIVQDKLRIQENRQLVARFLKEFGIDGSDTEVDQLAVMLEAMVVMDNREAVYRDIWRNTGGVQNLKDAKKKVMRQLSVLSTLVPGNPKPVLQKDHLDDAIDAINYLVFAVRNIRQINFDGVDDEEE
jgi:hypothetical protein